MKDLLASSLGEGYEKDAEQLEQTLRPKALVEFSGQPKIVENLKVFITAAKKKGGSIRPCFAPWTSWIREDNPFPHHCS